MGTDRDLVRCVGCCFLFVVLFLLVGLVWLWFCVGFVALHDLSHSLSPSHKRCEALHLSQ